MFEVLYTTTRRPLWCLPVSSTHWREAINQSSSHIRVKENRIACSCKKQSLCVCVLKERKRREHDQLHANSPVRCDDVKRSLVFRSIFYNLYTKKIHIFTTQKFSSHKSSKFALLLPSHSCMFSWPCSARTKVDEEFFCKFSRKKKKTFIRFHIPFSERYFISYFALPAVRRLVILRKSIVPASSFSYIGKKKKREKHTVISHPQQTWIHTSTTILVTNTQH